MGAVCQTATVPARSGAAELIGLLTRVFVQRGEWGVAELMLDDDELVRVSGPLGDDPILGVSYRVIGKWENSPRFGLQVRASLVLLVPPPGPAGLAGYLASRCEGIGWATAQRIAAACPADATPAAWLAGEPDIEGVSPSLVQVAAKHIDRDGALAEASIQARALLDGYRLGDRRLASILQAWGAQAPQVLRSTPYRLTEIDGIGWKIADAFALGRLGWPPDGEDRLEAATMHALAERERDGHSGTPPTLLDSDVRELTSVGHAAPLGAILDRELMWRPETLAAERTCAHVIAALVGMPREPVGLGGVLDGLDPSQAAALQELAGVPIGCLTGGPGTGKTTTIRALLRACPRATLVAPTGKAARRIFEQTQHHAETIHRALGITPGRAGTTKSFPPGGLVVCDEASMVGLDVGLALVSAVAESGSRLLLVGDEGQLPPVGPGGLLHACLESGCVPVARLGTTHRQSAGSLLELIRAVGRGDAEACLSLARTSPTRDVAVCRQGTPSAAAQMVVRASARCRELGLDWQVVSPTYRGELGCEALNEALQVVHAGTAPPTLDEARAQFGWRSEIGPRFVDSDRVVCNENHAAHLGVVQGTHLAPKGGEPVMNGQQGRIEAVDYALNRMSIRWDGCDASFTYALTDPRVGLGYAVTCHKAQGSEWPVVIVPFHRSLPQRMVYRAWAYTALSRARERLVIVGDERLVALAAATPNPIRHGRLPERIREEV